MIKQSKTKDADLSGVKQALQRAARTARRIAKATNTPLIIWKDGKVVEMSLN
jgi:hypothetical protein